MPRPEDEPVRHSEVQPGPHSEVQPGPHSEDEPVPHTEDATRPDAAVPDAAHAAADRPSGDRRAPARVTRGRRLVGALLAVVAIAGAGLVILWLPPSEHVSSAAEATVLEYELAREATWPKGATLGQPLSPAMEHMLAVALRARVARHAAAGALEGFDAAAAAAAFADAAAADLVHVVTRWKGEVVYFDFVRHALPDGVIVRAGVLKAQRVGRVDALHQRVYARRWVWQERAEIDEYRLREAGGVWKVVAVEPWGTCGPDGGDVVEGRRPM